MEQTLQFYTHIISIISGLLFWAGFFILGMIAYRYSKVFNKQTFYIFLMTAPSGILIYSLLLIIKISITATNPEINNIIQIIAYVFFVISVFFVLISILKFNSVLNALLKYT
ncbi:MAG: hypothetical protein N2114_02630, partial [Candidatus Goldbacteria bacterium]|nr:hypothetical protein [Candidatus Goldiibacteriota bacterium]